MQGIIPSSASFVFLTETGYCAVRFSSASDGIYYSRIINSVPLGTKRLLAFILKSGGRGKGPSWHHYMDALEKMKKHRTKKSLFRVCCSDLLKQEVSQRGCSNWM